MTNQTTTTMQLTDDQIIAKHHPDVRHRARVELAIVTKLIETATAAGCTLTVDDSDGDRDVKTEIFSDDESVVRVKGPKMRGWILLVRGNGADLVSDHTVGLTDFLQPVMDFADTFH